MGIDLNAKDGWRILEDTQTDSAYVADISENARFLQLPATHAKNGSCRKFLRVESELQLGEIKKMEQVDK